MNGEERSSPDCPFDRAMEFWRLTGRSIEPLGEDLTDKLRAVLRYLFRRDTPNRVLIYNSAEAWAAAIARAGERVRPALVAWSEICQASMGAVERRLPQIANTSEALEELFRCEVSLNVDFHYAPNAWTATQGSDQATAVWLVNFVPRAAEWEKVVAVSWALERIGGESMPKSRAGLARAVLGALAGCAGCVPLANGDVLVCRRPVKLCFDSRGMIGCDEGPAVVWADGTSHWLLCDVAVPNVLLPTLNRLHRRGNRGLVREFLRRELADLDEFRYWFLDTALRNGDYAVLDSDGPWGTPSGSVMRRAELRRVEFRGRAFNYVCELPEYGSLGAGLRAIAVPESVKTVADGLAHSFDLLTPTTSYRVIPRRNAKDV